MSSNTFNNRENRHYVTTPLLEETPSLVPIITRHVVSHALSWLLQKLPMSWPEPGQSACIITVLTPCHSQECSQHCHTDTNSPTQSCTYKRLHSSMELLCPWHESFPSSAWKQSARKRKHTWKSTDSYKHLPPLTTHNTPCPPGLPQALANSEN